MYMQPEALVIWLALLAGVLFALALAERRVNSFDDRRRDHHNDRPMQDRKPAAPQIRRFGDEVSTS